MSEIMTISTSVAPIYKKPTFLSEMVSQGLMWEKVFIIDKVENWIYSQLEDGYKGWINQFYLTKNEDWRDLSISICSDRFTHLYSSPNFNLPPMTSLSFGTSVFIINNDDKIVTIKYTDELVGYILPQKKLKQNRNEIINISKKLLGIPYLWGGKSSFGFDCSGFVQLVFKVIGIALERDSGEQYSASKSSIVSMNKAQAGDLVFFFKNNVVDHVGIYLGDGEIIHCSGYVKIDSLFKNKINYNKDLDLLDRTFLTIKDKLINGSYP